LDPLAQLSDIHLPSAVNQYPIAIGWWLLALLIIVLLVMATVRLRRYKKQRQVKNTALKQLQQNKEMNVDKVLLLIKWVALSYFPRQQCANLYGEKLQQFLLTTLPEKMPQEKKQQFREQLSQYTPVFERIYHKDGDNISDKKVNQLALTWLKNALPPQLKASAIAKQAIKEPLS